METTSISVFMHDSEYDKFKVTISSAMNFPSTAQGPFDKSGSQHRGVSLSPRETCHNLAARAAPLSGYTDRGDGTDFASVW